MSILDPVKDIKGSALRVQFGLSTREREAAEMTGTDFEENLDQLAWEQKLITSKGLALGAPEVLTDKKEENEEGGENNGGVLEVQK